VLCLAQTLDGFQLIGTTEGLMVIDQDEKVVEHFQLPNAHSRITAITVLGDQWCIGIGHTVMLLRRGVGGIQVEETADIDSTINDLFVDHADNIWIATNNLGLKKITCLRYAFQQIMRGKPRATFSIKQSPDKKILHIGGDGFFTRSTKEELLQGLTLSNTPYLPSTIVWDSLMDPIDPMRLWLATEDGLYFAIGQEPPRRLESKEKSIHSPNRVLLSRGKELWLGTISGLFKN
jgi:ligand-binding sensor domain-containing protein